MGAVKDEVKTRRAQNRVVGRDRPGIRGDLFPEVQMDGLGINLSFQLSFFILLCWKIYKRLPVWLILYSVYGTAITIYAMEQQRPDSHTSIFIAWDYLGYQIILNTHR